jgi:predicted component of viral defense system (DUF524 family)
MDAACDMLLIPAPIGAGGGSFLLCAAAGEVNLDPAACCEHPGLPSGWLARRYEGNGHAPIRIKEAGGTLVVRILESRGYEWALVGGSADASVTSSLQHENKQRWSIRRRPAVPPEGSFTVINHLGHARIEVSENGTTTLRILLEVCSTKIDYDTEYRAMTEDIAEFCSALLMRWQAPTGLRFANNAEQHARTLLERFFFLRHFLDESKAQALMAMVERNPHRSLVAEREWKPAGLVASPAFLRDPFRMASGWQRDHRNRMTPEHIVDIRKEESLDTEPNRFLLHVISSFEQLCADVIKSCGVDTPVGLEAKAMQEMMEELVGSRFFREVGRMRRIPLDNQTLQKRPGYRDFLRAWLLSEAAATVDWAGLEDSHQGDSRDVATLYEYWVFIKLNQILEKLPGVTPAAEDTTDPLAFIGSTEDGCVEIRLKSGKNSKRCFRYQSGETELVLELHYEREFRGGVGAHAAGSYSRIFRPDYTLSIRPASYRTEDAALAEGKVAFLHFDAKYRVEFSSHILGSDEMSADELNDEKQEQKSANFYKRADLLKMHTYNDALRMTIGSYVLYPGDTQSKMQRFHEIAPGVGAYAMKPGKEDCLAALGEFLSEIFEHQADRFTQYRYLADHQHRTVSDQPQVVGSGETEYRISQPGSTCVLIWMDPAREAVFKEKRFAYCRAIPREGSRPLELEISVQVGAELVPYGGGQGRDQISRNWRAKIRSAKFLTQQRLSDYLTGKVPPNWRMPAGASHYLLFEFDEMAPFLEMNLSGLAGLRQDGSRYMAFTCGWNELIECSQE